MIRFPETAASAALDDLRAAAARGQCPPLLRFFGHVPAGPGAGPWVLSQWWPAPFTVDGVSYRTAETFMMAGKAALFGDEVTRTRILAAPTPRQAKALGRAVRGFDEATWAAHRYDLVVRGSLAKFSAHPALRAYLLSSAPAVLVEASPYDRLWGIGVAASDPRSADPRRWLGANLLGFALTCARDLLVDGPVSG